jgi:hypothetical protein
MQLSLVKPFLIGKARFGMFVLKKHSPEILLAVGVIGIVGSTVMACRATLKADFIIDEAKDKFDKINEATEMQDEEYTNTDRQKDLITTYVQTGWEFIKLYGPSVTLGVASLACILVSQNILKGRALTAVAAYKAVEKSFGEYRKRVSDELGADADRHFRYNTKIETVTSLVTDPETGKTKKVKEELAVVTDLAAPGASPYAKWFDEGSKYYEQDHAVNLLFLKGMQDRANDRLHAEKHLFLNEVYNMLGLPKTRDGQKCGWLIGPDSKNYVDFGIYDANRAINRDFINGYEKICLLDFNIDGIMWDKI